ncbi:uncharacterized protein C05D11.13-like isoform X2 [Physella acuta]|nr:uncharacterized protein C05D11.13-like isoform X2 [Physella acuta]XP_059154892.1 uncharacterized protein C05D11.13-like isoform X2 [Physella acuta]XP_059154900.1 uncharacterized protein C05D11.13-like isoform X2 [Physella acuta]
MLLQECDNENTEYMLMSIKTEPDETLSDCEDSPNVYFEIAHYSQNHEELCAQDIKPDLHVLDIKEEPSYETDLLKSIKLETSEMQERITFGDSNSSDSFYQAHNLKGKQILSNQSIRKYEQSLCERSMFEKPTECFDLENSQVKGVEHTRQLQVSYNRKARWLERETPEQHLLRLQRSREYKKRSRENETPEQRALRLQRSREYKRKSLENETPEQRVMRLQRLRENKRKYLEKETAEQRSRRLQHLREYARKIRNKQSLEHQPVRSEETAPCTSMQYLQQLEKSQNTCVKDIRIKLSAKETPEQRSRRLQRLREYAKKMRSNETPEQRSLRLQRLRENQRRRHEHETFEQRCLRLERLREQGKKYRAVETQEQQSQRLQHLREIRKENLQHQIQENCAFCV